MTMICPDCGNMIGYNSYFSAFYCPRCGGIFKKVKPMTNADRIRSMNDEELAMFLCDFRSCDAGEYMCEGCKAEKYCRAGHAGTIDWLQQPAEVDND